MIKAADLCKTFQEYDGDALKRKIKPLIPQPYKLKKDMENSLDPDDMKTHYKSKFKDTTMILTFMFERAMYCIRKGRGNVKLAKKIVDTLKSLVTDPFKGTITLTFGEVAESHVGMQKIGNEAEVGFSHVDLVKTQNKFIKGGCKTLLIRLNDFLPKEGWEGITEKERHELQEAKTKPEFEAYVLVVKNGLKALTGDDGKELLTEMLLYKWDTMLYNERRKKVQNKNARYNVNFDQEKQVEEFSKGKGTTIPWREAPILKRLKKKLVLAFGEKAEELKCEGNLYYKSGDTGIGYHGDTERKKVVGVRLGKKMNIHWMWYYNNLPRGTNFSTILEPGDIYCMSEKTVGTDWLRAPKKRYTLRHAAGASKYTTNTPKIRVENIEEKDHGIREGEIKFKQKKGKTGKWKNWREYN